MYFRHLCLELKGLSRSILSHKYQCNVYFGSDFVFFSLPSISSSSPIGCVSVKRFFLFFQDGPYCIWEYSCIPSFVKYLSVLHNMSIRTAKHLIGTALAYFWFIFGRKPVKWVRQETNQTDVKKKISKVHWTKQGGLKAFFALLQLDFVPTGAWWCNASPKK